MTSFKPLQIAEIDIIADMMQEFYAIDDYPINIEESKKLFEEFITNENLGKAYLICHSYERRISEIVGYAILTFVFSFEYKGKIAFFDELYIKSSFRGKGIGKQAVEFIQSEALKFKLKLLYLEVENHNLTAQKLYLASRFETHNRKIMKYKL
jgi:ribosomal protein S18 acetylase RimI-like enzyme